MAARLLSVVVFGAICLAGCSVLPPQPLTHSPGFAPVYPVASEVPEQASGSLYNSLLGETFLGRTRNFKVGDVITVALTETSQATRTQNNTLSRTASNNALPVEAGGGLLNVTQLAGAKMASTGVGSADQYAKLTGSVVVSVV